MVGSLFLFFFVQTLHDVSDRSAAQMLCDDDVGRELPEKTWRRVACCMLSFARVLYDSNATEASKDDRIEQNISV